MKGYYTMTNEELQMKRKPVLETKDDAYLSAIFAYGEDYKAFLDASKTEREAVKTAVAMAKDNGYTEYRLGDVIRKGGKYYFNNRGKNLFLFRIGTAPLDEVGLRILAAHIDSPRIDIKQNPLYEDSGMCFLKTHYYGGIKKYQWPTLPLALHGVVVLRDGTVKEVRIGEDENDPVFYINDLLPHLAQDQSAKPLGSAISGESLNIFVGGIPYMAEEGDDRIKMNILHILNEKYGMTEADFLSAELSAVPAFKARDVGFDRLFIGAYGHDDRVCAYPELTALFASEDTVNSSLVILADKEETGSDGNTGMSADIMLDLIDEISRAFGASPARVRAASKCLSADVTAAYDPNFAEVYEKKNSSFVSCGTAVCKFTGARGKSSTNDASAEFMGFIRRVFDDAGVAWQTCELGKVDQGGGGTVAKFISKHNIDTIDVGVPVISMHAPYEMISKVDIYETHRALLAFIEA